MMEKNNFILRLKARQALAGHWANRPGGDAGGVPAQLAGAIASLVAGGRAATAVLTVLQYGNPELLADPQYLLRLGGGPCWVPRGCCPTCSACCPFW